MRGTRTCPPPPCNLQDAGAVMGFSGGTLNVNNTTPGYGQDMVNILPYHQLFLRSNLGNDMDVFGPDGSSDIIRRIIVERGLNEMIVDRHGIATDSITVENRQLASLSFRLTDYKGSTVDTNGHPLSFSLIILPEF